MCFPLGMLPCVSAGEDVPLLLRSSKPTTGSAHDRRHGNLEKHVPARMSFRNVNGYL